MENWCTSRKFAKFCNCLKLLKVRKGVHQVMKFNKNNRLENLGYPPLGSSISRPWGAPILAYNIRKSKNKKGGELEGLTL